MASAATGPSSAGGVGNNPSSPDDKVMGDLDTLSEQIDLCVEMLRESHGQISRDNEALLGVVGFLEACAPRMVELVEAAAQGALKEATLMRCLELNDRLTKVLSDCDDPQKAANSSAASSSAPAPAAAAAKSSVDVDLDDLLLDDSPRKKSASNFMAAGGGGGTTGKTEDPFGGTGPPDLLAPSAATADSFTIDDGEGGGSGKKGDEDEFDAFFKERTG